MLFFNKTVDSDDFKGSKTLDKLLDALKARIPDLSDAGSRDLFIDYEDTLPLGDTPDVGRREREREWPF